MSQITQTFSLKSSVFSLVLTLAVGQVQAQTMIRPDLNPMDASKTLEQKELISKDLLNEYIKVHPWLADVDPQSLPTILEMIDFQTDQRIDVRCDIAYDEGSWFSSRKPGYYLTMTDQNGDMKAVHSEPYTIDQSRDLLKLFSTYVINFQCARPEPTEANVCQIVAGKKKGTVRVLRAGLPFSPEFTGGSKLQKGSGGLGNLNKYFRYMRDLTAFHVCQLNRGLNSWQEMSADPAKLQVLRELKARGLFQRR